MAEFGQHRNRLLTAAAATAAAAADDDDEKTGLSTAYGVS